MLIDVILANYPMPYYLEFNTKYTTVPFSSLSSDWRENTVQRKDSFEARWFFYLNTCIILNDSLTLSGLISSFVYISILPCKIISLYDLQN